MGISKKNVEKEDSPDGKMKYLKDALLISSMNKEEIVAWMEKFKEVGTKLHIRNWYNLALACKNKSLFQ
jgi:thymidine phosphorylase